MCPMLNILTHILLCIWKIPRTDTITIFVGLIRTSFVSKRHWFFSTCQIKMYLKFQTCQRRVARMEEGRWTRRRSWASSTRSSELSGAHQNPIIQNISNQKIYFLGICAIGQRRILTPSRRIGKKQSNIQSVILLLLLQQHCV